MYNPTPEQAEIDRQKAYETGIPHGYVPPGDKYAGHETIRLKVKSDLVRVQLKQPHKLGIIAIVCVLKLLYGLSVFLKLVPSRTLSFKHTASFVKVLTKPHKLYSSKFGTKIKVANRQLISIALACLYTTMHLLTHKQTNSEGYNILPDGKHRTFTAHRRGVRWTILDRCQPEDEGGGPPQSY